MKSLYPLNILWSGVQSLYGLHKCATHKGVALPELP